MPNQTECWVDASATPGGDGSEGDPYASIQEAFDNVTKGDYHTTINLEATGGAFVLSAQPNLTQWDLNSGADRMTVQGVNGQAEIDLDGNSFSALPTATYTNWRNLEIHNGTSHGLVGADLIENCYVHDMGDRGISGGFTAIGCRIENCSTGLRGTKRVIRCFLKDITGHTGLYVCDYCYQCIVIDAVAGARTDSGDCLVECVFYTTTGTGVGVLTSGAFCGWYGNIVEGYATGFQPGSLGVFAAHNRTYDTATPWNKIQQLNYDKDNVDLGASPFLKSGAATYANRFNFFAPAESVRGLIPQGPA